MSAPPPLLPVVPVVVQHVEPEMGRGEGFVQAKVLRADLSGPNAPAVLASVLVALRAEGVPLLNVLAVSSGTLFIVPDETHIVYRWRA